MLIWILMLHTGVRGQTTTTALLVIPGVAIQGIGIRGIMTTSSIHTRTTSIYYLQVGAVGAVALNTQTHHPLRLPIMSLHILTPGPTPRPRAANEWKEWEGKSSYNLGIGLTPGQYSESSCLLLLYSSRWFGEQI